MKHFLPLLVLTLLLPSHVFGAIDPVFKECRQRGYEQTYDNDADGSGECLFPDGTTCEISAFNAGTCGAEYSSDDDYCIAEGNYVWDTDRCCSGTEAYLPAHNAGQPVCTSISRIEKTYDAMRFSPTLRTYVFSAKVFLIGVGVFLFIHFRRKRKKT